MMIWKKYGHEVLVRAFDFTDELAPGDSIVSAEASMSGDVLVDRCTFEGPIVTFWLSGGASPSLQSLSCTVVTTDGETLEGRITLQVAG